MKANDKALKAQALTQPLYFQCRHQALALALACTTDVKAAYAQSRDAFVRAGERALRKPQRDLEVLRDLYAKARPPKAVSTQELMEAAPGLLQLNRQQRAAWALCRVSGLSQQDAQWVLRLSEQAVAEAISEADAQLDQHHVESYGRLLDSMQNKREIWGEVGFSLTQHYRLSRYVRTAVVSLLLLVIGVFLIREGRLAVKVLGFPGSRQPDVIAQGYEEPDFYKRFAPLPGIEAPRVEQRLWERLQPLDESQQLRVAFRFYDPALMADIKEGDRNLLQLYEALYQQGASWGRVHTLMARAIEQYYRNYDRPFMVKDRTADFQSDFASLYDSALHVAQGSGFMQTLSAQPEVFADEASFNDYLISPRFRGELPEVARLCYAYSVVRQAQLKHETIDAQSQEVYETLIFAFHNPIGLGGKLAPASFSYTQADTDAFFPVRQRLGEHLYEQTLRRVKSLLPQAQVTSDILEGSESSLFSATLTKAEILRLARGDARFSFIGIAPPYAQGYLPGLEHGLADAISQDKERVYEVYLVDREYVLYSINYAAPLTLPQGFIDQLRVLVPSQDTLFEQLIGYTYQIRFAHPTQMPGWRILRDIYKNEALHYTLRQYKHFSLMDRY